VISKVAAQEPENNQASKLALQWIDEWLLNMKTTFGKGN
jgi:hypothetical protein